MGVHQILSGYLCGFKWERRAIQSKIEDGLFYYFCHQKSNRWHLLLMQIPIIIRGFSILAAICIIETPLFWKLSINRFWQRLNWSVMSHCTVNRMDRCRLACLKQVRATSDVNGRGTWGDWDIHPEYDLRRTRNAIVYQVYHKLHIEERCSESFTCFFTFTRKMSFKKYSKLLLHAEYIVWRSENKGSFFGDVFSLNRTELDMLWL